MLEGFGDRDAALIRAHVSAFLVDVRRFWGDLEPLTVKIKRAYPGTDITGDRFVYEQKLIELGLLPDIPADFDWRARLVSLAHEIGHLVITKAVLERHPDYLKQMDRNHPGPLGQIDDYFQEFFADTFAGFYFGHLDAMAALAPFALYEMRPLLEMRAFSAVIPTPIMNEFAKPGMERLLDYYGLQPTKNELARAYLLPPAPADRAVALRAALRAVVAGFLASVEQGNSHADVSAHNLALRRELVRAGFLGRP